MGKGKGSFDHWATRVAINQIVLELKGIVHEQVVRDAFRLAGNKLPGKKWLWMPYSTMIANDNFRSMGVCEEGRAAGRGSYQVGGRCHIGGTQEAEEEDRCKPIAPRAISKHISRGREAAGFYAVMTISGGVAYPVYCAVLQSVGRSCVKIQFVTTIVLLHVLFLCLDPVSIPLYSAVEAYKPSERPFAFDVKS